jgi:hypothetical protein
MSTPNPIPTAPYLVQLVVASLPLPAGSNPEAAISAVVTDTTGIAQNPVSLVGTETPPWSFVAQLTPSSTAGSITFTPVDSTGAPVAGTTALTGPFTIAPAATFNSPASFTVTPVVNTAATAAAHVAAARK